MKKKLFIPLISMCLILMTACGRSKSANPEDGGIDVQGTGENKMASPEDRLIVVSGTYDIGDYISNRDYLITCEETDYSMQVIVFESKETYNNYQNTKRITYGEERTAIEQNALYDYHLKKGETGYLSFGDGYVLLIDSGNGRLKEIGETKKNSTDLFCGTYFVGNDIKASRYQLACTEAEYSMQVLVFENMETYKKYHQTSRFTNGEERAAIEQNALYDCYLNPEEMGYLNLAVGYILFIDGGKGELSELNIDSGTTWYSDKNIGLCRGVYFTGNDLEAAQYSLTCTDSYMRAIVFENIDAYKAYHQSSRFTGGEESEAIEKNAIINEYVYEDNSVAINLHEGNVLLINAGMGILEAISK